MYWKAPFGTKARGSHPMSWRHRRMYHQSRWLVERQGIAGGLRSEWITRHDCVWRSMASRGLCWMGGEALTATNLSSTHVVRIHLAYCEHEWSTNSSTMTGRSGPFRLFASCGRPDGLSSALTGQVLGWCLLAVVIALSVEMTATPSGRWSFGIPSVFLTGPTAFWIRIAVLFVEQAFREEHRLQHRILRLHA